MDEEAVLVGRYDLGRALVERIITRALKDMENDSRRTARRLVDLGLTLAKGPFERKFLTACRRVLEDKASIYDQTLERALRDCDRQTLITFGINAGFEGCSRGAERIREIEADRGFNIPWTIRMDVGREALDMAWARKIIAQATTLGVHVFRLVDCGLEQEELMRLLQENPTCAFVLFTTGCREPQWEPEGLSGCHGLLFSVCAQSPGARALCHKLTQARMPYAVHLDYDDQSGEILSSILAGAGELGGLLVLLRGDRASEQTRQAVSQQIVSARAAGAYPFVPIDLGFDLLAIDRVISSDACALSFLPDGRAVTHRGITDASIKTMSLEEILLKELAKA